VPGPTATVTEFVSGPQPVETITAPAQTVTTTPNAGPTSTVTITAEPSRQPATEGGTIGPDNNDTVLTFPKIELSTPEVVGLGIGTVALMMLLIILGMWAGYYLGYKDSDKAEARFLKSLLTK